MSEVVNFTGITTLKGDPDRVLSAALGKLDTVVVIGFDAEGEEYFAANESDGGTVLWLLERLKKQLLETVDE